MGIFRIITWPIWNGIKFGGLGSIVLAGVEAQTGMKPDTHALGNEYGQKTAADVLLLGGRLVLNVSSDFAAKSPYFTKPGPLDKLKA